MSRTPTILIIEDDPNFAEVLRDTFAKHEYTVVVANRPSEALIKLKNQRFSCIIIDLQLPNSSGVAVMQHIRNENGPDTLNLSTPIIIMSGALDADVVKTVARQVQGVLAKPFAAETILNKVTALISAR